MPCKLITKLRRRRMNTCNWILYFLTGCPKVVRVGNTSAMLTFEHGTPSVVRA